VWIGEYVLSAAGEGAPMVSQPGSELTVVRSRSSEEVLASSVLNSLYRSRCTDFEGCFQTLNIASF
jgi:hypothetical protein